MGLIMGIIFGIFSGWLAGKIWKGKGFGLIGDSIVGVLAKFLEIFFLVSWGIFAIGILGNIIASVVGALILLWLLHQIKK